MARIPVTPEEVRLIQEGYNINRNNYVLLHTFVRRAINDRPGLLGAQAEALYTRDADAAKVRRRIKNIVITRIQK